MGRKNRVNKVSTIPIRKVEAYSLFFSEDVQNIGFTRCFPEGCLSASIGDTLDHMCDDDDDDDWDDSDDGDSHFLDDDEYDQFVDEHFPNRLTNTKTKPLWRFVAVVLLAVFAGAMVFNAYDRWLGR